jgi:hypothetical protein
MNTNAGVSLSEKLAEPRLAASEKKAVRQPRVLGGGLIQAATQGRLLGHGERSSLADLTPLSNAPARLLPNAPARPLRPLLVSVKAAAELLGIGLTSMWGLIGGEIPGGEHVQVVHIGKRTLVVLASLDSLIAALSTPARQTSGGLP